MEKTIAKIAVSAATYQIDRPYSYIVPDELAADIRCGMRVLVPFSRSNRQTEGIVLELFRSEKGEALKCVLAVLDREPVLSDELLKLALWMRERFFCTVYDAVKAMLPAGLWYALSSVVSLSDGVDRAYAYDRVTRSEKQKKVLDVLFAHKGQCERRELERAFGAEDPAAAVRALVQKGILQTEQRGTRRVRDKTASFAALAVSAEEARDAAGTKKRSAPSQAAVLSFLADYGGATVSDIRYMTGASLPTIKRLEKDGLVSIEQMEVFRRPEYRVGPALPLPKLTARQQAAFEGILSLAIAGKPGAALLYGVTGSGKTSVYIHLIDALLQSGRSTILLVPEIALTPQMLETFSSHFGSEIAVMHSSLSVGERYDEWKRIRRGEARLVIGTRSAVFAPVQNLGLIILDEEQEDSYKSENAPRYHARDIAKFRCARNGAFLLMGSATPDLVTMYAAKSGRYALFTLPERFNRRALPQVEIVDMKRELRNGNGGDLSSVLLDALAETITRGEQSILFLNRRGNAKLITCRECGYTYSCPRCSVSLTYHSANGRLMCHYCGYSQTLGECCPECGGALHFVGAGTQKIEQELSIAFPDTPLIRLDTDTVAKAGSHDVLLNRFRDEKIPILIGTQMVTKGLDFPNVTLVGVLAADQSLYAGDYRASERTFSLLTQVIGRSGRGEKPGHAIIQTFTPQNEVIRQAAAQDYERFYSAELELRRLQWCPPFSELFSLTAVGQNEAQVLRCLTRGKQLLTGQLRSRADARLLGPAPLSVARVCNRFRYRLTIACADDRAVRELLAGVILELSADKAFKGVTVYGDINANQQ